MGQKKHETYAYFWVSGFESVPKITRLMGIAPSRSRSAGKKRKGHWEITSPLPRNEKSLNAHVAALLEILEPKKEALEELWKRYAIGITRYLLFSESSSQYSESCINS